jgi:hypothetical protein
MLRFALGERAVGPCENSLCSTVRPLLNHECDQILAIANLSGASASHIVAVSDRRL